MRMARAHATVGLLLLLTWAIAGAAPTTTARVGPGWRRAEGERNRGRPETETATAAGTTSVGASWSRRRSAVTVMTTTSHGKWKDSKRSKTDRRDRTFAGSPQDHRRKEKYLKHITGQLYFSPRCWKHVYHVYYHTRDCTIPAYIKRCARLLTRLAGSPMCTGS
ncbi:ALK and LTK ligand 2a-like [Syngnathoides biaculeatus]|uniref:ALK and LTK ligand 2a-like n=1 Tax=Syngnathoides biaculeatus TaxID=300417 RepID=UPI002ADD4ED1|nr:ALK and LTK ligand 2a-like [Syngnathoides biaculeatus]XP_061667515.1 ALK and LTK ligand 2a-like [Syngnathoides biaculeatus]